MSDREIQALQSRIDSLERQSKNKDHIIKTQRLWRGQQFRVAYAAAHTSAGSDATQLPTQRQDLNRQEEGSKKLVEELETTRRENKELIEELKTTREQLKTTCEELVTTREERSAQRRAYIQLQGHCAAMERQTQALKVSLACVDGHTNVEKPVQEHMDDDDDDELSGRRSYRPSESSSETPYSDAGSEDELRTSHKRARASCDAGDAEETVQQPALKRARVGNAGDAGDADHADNADYADYADHADDTDNTDDTDDTDDIDDAHAHDAQDNADKNDKTDNEDGFLANETRSLTIDPSSEPEPQREAVRLPRIAREAGVRQRRDAEKLLPKLRFKWVTRWTRNDHAELYNSEDCVDHVPELWKATEEVKDVWEEKWGQSFMDAEYFQPSQAKKECVSSRARNKRGRWRDGALGRYACQTCVRVQEPCVYWDGERLLLLPLHRDDRRVRPPMDLDMRTWVAA